MLAGWLACYGFIPQDGKSSRPSCSTDSKGSEALSHNEAVYKLVGLMRASEPDLQIQHMSRGLVAALHSLLVRERDAAAGERERD